MITLYGHFALNHRPFTARSALSFTLLCILVACGSSQRGTTSDGSTSTTTDATHIDVGSGIDIGVIGNDSAVDGVSGDGQTSNGSLLLTASPASLTITVTVVNNAVTAMSAATSTITVKTLDGTVVTDASFSLNRSDIGSVDPTTGVFTATGFVAGTATVYAQSGNNVGSVPIVITIAMSQSGPNETDPLGATNPSGYWGVGGEGPGGVPDAAHMTLLTTGTATADSSMAWLYPYNKTVWPRGLLPPLLQWDSNNTADAIHIQLKETGYQWDGYYQYGAEATTAVEKHRHPIEPTVWTDAISSNTDGAMTLNLWYTSGGVLYGPFTESWAIAGGSLKGTVYYASYDSALVSAYNDIGGVLSIRPSTAIPPVLAIPSLSGQCHVCHEVSANGSTLYTNGTPPNYGEDDSASYDLTNADTLIQSYDNNQDIFTWSGVYPDGTFGLANSQDNWHSYSQNSNLFDRNTQLAIPITGFTDFITKAVTPIFSPDGLHVAFNFWTGIGTNGVIAGNGQSLVAMDFNCGAAPGSIACSGTPPYAFSNLRQIYSATSTSEFVGQPTFSPDGNYVIFQHTLDLAPQNTCESCSPTTTACSIDGSTGTNCTANGGSNLNTFGLSYLQLVDAQLTPTLGGPLVLCALNGMNSDCNTASTPTPYLPTHSFGGITWDDIHMNYEPNASPIASGGYTWVIFTTRRRYGNIAMGDPYDGRTTYSAPAAPPITKKLWVAAIDLSPQAGTDPSHPAFYLPAQEINVGNMRGFMVADACAQNGAACETGDECCGGFCRSDSTGAFTCTNKVTGCSNVYEHCVTAADCCNSSNKCIDNLCTATSPIVLVQ